ncbi:MAG: permease [Firmicutes bacterium]|nr:permease [Bacillota bacterium]
MSGKLKNAISLFFLLTLLLTYIMFYGFSIPPAAFDKLPQLVTVFVSIVIQALPFVLIGVFSSAALQNLITIEMIENKLAKTSKLPGILLAIGAGFFFPVCDCGVIPVVRRLLLKRVPPYMAIAFLVAAPLVNPITVWATATAFGYNLTVTLIRVGMAVLVGIIVALWVSRFYPSLKDILNQKTFMQLAPAAAAETAHPHSKPSGSKIAGIFSHAEEEFLEVGRFLIIGALIAATVQTMVPKQSLVAITQSPALSVLVMMALAVTLSLCAEADAFVARSFVYHFPLGSIMAFMVFGQMIDLKNLALLLKIFKPRAVFFIFGLCAILVLIFCSLLNGFSANNSLIWGRF